MHDVWIHWSNKSTSWIHQAQPFLKRSSPGWCRWCIAHLVIIGHINSFFVDGVPANAWRIEIGNAPCVDPQALDELPLQHSWAHLKIAAVSASNALMGSRNVHDNYVIWNINEPFVRESCNTLLSYSQWDRLQEIITWGKLHMNWRGISLARELWVDWWRLVTPRDLWTGSGWMGLRVLC